MKHCPECGAGVRREGAKFCEECGFGLAADTAASRQSMETVSAPVTHSGPDRATVSLAIGSPAAVWAGFLLLFAVFFPWLTSPVRVNTAMGIPLEFLWSRSAPAGGFKLGTLLLILAGVAIVASVIPAASILRRAVGLIITVVGVLLVVQWVRFLAASGSADQWLGYIGLGIYCAIVAGFVLLVAPSVRRAG